MLRMTVAALTFAASATVALAATDDEIKQQLVGPWGQLEGCTNGTLTFDADGTFAIVRPDHDPESGTWALTEGVLTGSGMPDVTVTFTEDNKLVMGDPAGGPRKETFYRCPE